MNWRLMVGDVREQLALLPDACVQTCVTSPPYWGLRDYGTGRWEGGDIECSHASGNQVQDGKAPGAITTGQRPGVDASRCKKCGARRIDNQIGLEASPREFVEALVGVFRDVKRVLKPDGTLWMNLGDSYLAQQGSGFNGRKRLDHANRNVKVKRPDGMKPKDLAGIPWMVAFALRDDGWYLRSDIIWAKPNPMPESVTDRPTKAHEYIFLLSKRANYYYDAAAIRTPYSASTLREFEEGYEGQGTKDYAAVGVQNPSDLKRRMVDKQRGHGRRHAGFNDRWDAMPKDVQQMDGANARTVWSIATQPYPEAHFATFPEALPERCIKAGTSERGQCPQCGAPWVRHCDDGRMVRVRDGSDTSGGSALESAKGAHGSSSIFTTGEKRVFTTIGWRPSCACGLEPVPQLVLDPFTGSGTTGEVAIRLGREFIGIELNEQYAALARKRIGSAAPLFAVEAATTVHAVAPSLESAPPPPPPPTPLGASASPTASDRLRNARGHEVPWGATGSTASTNEEALS